MFGIILTMISSVFREVGTSIGKIKESKGEECQYSLGFINLFWGGIFFLLIAFFVRGEFIFSLASLPTFSLRIILEILQVYFMIKAVVLAERSTVGLLGIWTIPLLLLIDISLGYTFSSWQFLGIIIIILGFVFLFLNHGIKKKGALFAVLAAINAAFTISLFKYNIDNFNSVEAEQGVIIVILLIFLFIMAKFKSKENPLRIMFQNKAIFVQSIMMGVASLGISFAYIFAPASIITVVKRSSAILTSMVSGKIYFHEKKMGLKVIVAIIIIFGIILISIF